MAKTDLSRLEEHSDKERELLKPKSDEATFARLAMLSPLEYDRVRETEAEALGCRVSTLDRLVDSYRAKHSTNLQGHALSLPEIEPWPEVVNGADVLSEASEVISRYVALPPGAADVIAVWCAHTHIFSAFEHTPRLNFTSPEKGCGKTTARDVVTHLVARPLSTENITTAVLFRVIESSQPTILADEYDAWLARNEELRGLLNAGHKRGGQSLRCEGDDHEVRAFNVFAPALLCGIGVLPGTLADRSVKIQLGRAKRGEVRERFDSRRTDHFHALARKLARFTEDSRSVLEGADPIMPESAYNRIADNWRVLFAIAEAAGGNWVERIALAFIKLVDKKDLDAQGIGTMLLADLQFVFADQACERISSRSLVRHLISMRDRPWPEVRNGREISERWLADHLRGFGIYPKTLRIDSKERAKGYEVSQFEDAFERYVNVSDQCRDTVTMPVDTGRSEKMTGDNGHGCHGSQIDETSINSNLSRCHGSKPETQEQIYFPTDCENDEDARAVVNRE